MSAAASIVVVGSSNTDLVVATDRLPGAGETVLGGEFLMTAGGKGANQAVAAARLGARVSLVARVGDDLFGERALAGLAAEGIDTEQVRRDPEAASGVALIVVGTGGENLIAVAPGANQRLSVTDVDLAAETIRGADLLLLQLEVPLAAVRRATEIAAGAGVRVILDPAPAQPLDDELLRRVTVLTPNESEAGRLTGSEVHDQATARAAAESLVRRGVLRVIVTRGASGCVLASPGRVTRLPAPAVRAIDSTAAGDAFNGALAVALAEGAELEAAAGFATRAAALSVTRRGAQASMARRDELGSGLC